MKGLKYKPHKYGEIYKEMENMSEGLCARKECDNAKEAKNVLYSIKRTLERKKDDRFELTVRGKCIYISRVK